jgi:hypothetical protein
MKTLIYLLQVSACTGIFYSFYYLFLRRLTFFTLNRWYLLATLLLSFVIPALTIPLNATEASPIMQPVAFVQQMQTVQQSETTIMQAPADNVEPFNWMALIKDVYITMAIASVVHLLITLILFFRRMGNKKLMQIGNVKVLKGSKKLGNSSFLNVIFINDDELEPEEIKQIITHEMLHVKLMHSADRLIARLIQIVLWFNPFAYCYIRSIEENHEFEVDRIAAGKDDKGIYATLLFKLAVSGQSYLFHGFSKVPLKTRINMLFNKPTSNMKKIVYLLILPMVVISCLAFANLKPKKQKEHRFTNKSADTTIIDTVKKYRQKTKQTLAQKLEYEKSKADFEAYTKSADHKYKNALARRVHMQTLLYKVVGMVDSMYNGIHLSGYRLTQGGDKFVLCYNYNNRKTLKGLFKAGDEIQLKSIGERWLKSIPVIVEPTLIAKDNEVIFQLAEATTPKEQPFYTITRHKSPDETELETRKIILPHGKGGMDNSNTYQDTAKFRQKIKRTPARQKEYDKFKAEQKVYQQTDDYKQKTEALKEAMNNTLTYKVTGFTNADKSKQIKEGFTVSTNNKEFTLTTWYGQSKLLKNLLKVGDEIQVKVFLAGYGKGRPIEIEPAFVIKGGKEIYRVAEAAKIPDYAFLYEANQVRFTKGQVTNIKKYANGKWKSAVVEVVNGYKIKFNVKPDAPDFKNIEWGDHVIFRFVHEVKTGAKEYTVNNWVSLSNDIKDYGIKNPDYFYKFYEKG